MTVSVISFFLFMTGSSGMLLFTVVGILFDVFYDALTRHYNFLTARRLWFIMSADRNLTQSNMLNSVSSPFLGRFWVSFFWYAVKFERVKPWRCLLSTLVAFTQSAPISQTNNFICQIHCFVPACAAPYQYLLLSPTPPLLPQALPAMCDFLLL